MVGRNLSEFAIRNGLEVYTPTRSQLNLLDKSAVREYISLVKPDLVIHCAGLVGGIQANIAAPYDFCYHNLQIGLNVVSTAFDCGVEKLINLGSSCMYPKSASNPLKENQLLSGQLEPTNEGYAIAKLAVAKLAEYLSTQHGCLYKTFIPCNLYGRWDKFEADRSHMIPAVIRKIHDAIQRNENSVEIWGDGESRREFMFVEDLADFILYSLDSLELLPNSLNVGLGFDYSINDYYQTVADVLGYQGGFTHDLSKPAGMKQKLVDVSIQNKFGWKPQTSLVDGIKRTYRYYLEEVI